MFFAAKALVRSIAICASNKAQFSTIRIMIDAKTVQDLKMTDCQIF